MVTNDSTGTHKYNTWKKVFPNAHFLQFMTFFFEPRQNGQVDMNMNYLQKKSAP